MSRLIVLAVLLGSMVVQASQNDQRENEVGRAGSGRLPDRRRESSASFDESMDENQREDSSNFGPTLNMTASLVWLVQNSPNLTVEQQALVFFLTAAKAYFHGPGQYDDMPKNTQQARAYLDQKTGDQPVLNQQILRSFDQGILTCVYFLKLIFLLFRLCTDTALVRGAAR